MNKVLFKIDKFIQIMFLHKRKEFFGSFLFLFGLLDLFVVMLFTFYALEMKEREKELNPKKDFFEWLVFKFHGLSSNHSQDWTLVLFWIININFFYSYLNIETNMWMLAFKILFSLILILLIGCMIVKIPEDNEKKRWLTTIPITIVCYFFYGYLVEKDWLLSEYSKNLNPFSIMRADEAINFGTLLFKIIIAYLIYQLIISIRQNTRRK